MRIERCRCILALGNGRHKVVGDVAGMGAADFGAGALPLPVQSLNALDRDRRM